VNKLVGLAVFLATATAFADGPPGQTPNASPWGTSPYVVAYQPPAVVPSEHHGLTLEAAFAGGSTSSESSTGGFTFAIGGWLHHDFALAFRATAVGSFDFVGVSAQYYPTESLWLGAGLGSLQQKNLDMYDGTTRINGGGAFARIGYELAGGHPHTLYVSGELQAGAIDNQTRAVAIFALGYQLL